jgi:hypothetical protein
MSFIRQPQVQRLVVVVVLLQRLVQNWCIVIGPSCTAVELRPVRFGFYSNAFREDDMRKETFLLFRLSVIFFCFFMTSEFFN